MNFNLNTLGVDLGLIIVVYAMTVAWKNLIHRVLVPYLERKAVKHVILQWGPKLTVFWFVPGLCVALSYLTVPETAWKPVLLTAFKLYAGSLIAYNVLKNHFPITSMTLDGKK